MSIINCHECGKEISDQAEKCPNCGCPIHTTNAMNQSNSVKSKEGKVSGLSIAALIFSILGCTFIIGVILAIIDLCIKDGRKKNCSIVALAICGLWFIIGVSNVSKKDPEQPASSDQRQEQIETANNNKEENNVPVEDEAVAAQEDQEEQQIVETGNTESMSEEEYKELCTEYDYKDVLRNPENYVGEKITITLRISSVHEAGFTNPTKYYFAYSKSDYGWYGDRYAVYDTRDEQDPKLLSEDIIIVWGEIADTAQTSSLILNSEELFVINMKYVEIIDE